MLRDPKTNSSTGVNQCLELHQCLALTSESVTGTVMSNTYDASCVDYTTVLSSILILLLFMFPDNTLVEGGARGVIAAQVDML